MALMANVIDEGQGHEIAGQQVTVQGKRSVGSEDRMNTRDRRISIRGQIVAKY